MKKIGLILLTLLLSGCATNTNAGSEYSADDINFAEQMIPHHEQAIEMSDLALTNSANPEVLKLAQEIKAAQSPEIELMKSWPGVTSSTHMGHLMDGMLSGNEIENLRDTTGVTFDKLFLQGMIVHHEGAIKMAQQVAESANKGVAELAAAVIAAQNKEISLMKDLIKNF